MDSLEPEVTGSIRGLFGRRTSSAALTASRIWKKKKDFLKFFCENAAARLLRGQGFENEPVNEW
jgi:hypothetical protein